MDRDLRIGRRAFLGGGAALAGAAGLRPAWAASLRHGVAAKTHGHDHQGSRRPVTAAATIGAHPRLETGHLKMSVIADGSSSCGLSQPFSKVFSQFFAQGRP